MEEERLGILDEVLIKGKGAARNVQRRVDAVDPRGDLFDVRARVCVRNQAILLFSETSMFTEYGSLFSDRQVVSVNIRVHRSAL
jgi:hypothetical protein